MTGSRRRSKPAIISTRANTSAILSGANRNAGARSRAFAPHWSKARIAANRSLLTPSHSRKGCRQCIAEYRLSPATEHDLENIWRYTYQQWSMQQADHYIDTLVAAFAQLANSPLIAASCDHIRPDYRRYNVEW